jgi:hypothetical protein
MKGRSKFQGNSLSHLACNEMNSKLRVGPGSFRCHRREHDVVRSASWPATGGKMAESRYIRAVFISRKTSSGLALTLCCPGGHAEPFDSRREPDVSFRFLNQHEPMWPRSERRIQKEIRPRKVKRGHSGQFAKSITVMPDFGP